MDTRGSKRAENGKTAKEAVAGLEYVIGGMRNSMNVQCIAVGAPGYPHPAVATAASPAVLAMRSAFLWLLLHDGAFYDGAFYEGASHEDATCEGAFHEGTFREEVFHEEAVHEEPSMKEIYRGAFTKVCS